MFSGEQAVGWVRRTAGVVEEHAVALTRLDAAIGDGDHGTNMVRGFRAVLQRLDGLTDKDFSSVFRAVGMALIGKVGGAAGPLYGSFYLGMGKQLGSAEEATDAELAAALRAGYDAVIARGKAQLIARKGRASYLGERSKDHQDPGATSSQLIVQALADVVNGR